MRWPAIVPEIVRAPVLARRVTVRASENFLQGGKGEGVETDQATGAEDGDTVSAD
jgi:hypothetical protein